jgi:hypothetical protein
MMGDPPPLRNHATRLSALPTTTTSMLPSRSRSATTTAWGLRTAATVLADAHVTGDPGPPDWVFRYHTTTPVKPENDATASCTPSPSTSATKREEAWTPPGRTPATTLGTNPCTARGPARRPTAVATTTAQHLFDATGTARGPGRDGVPTARGPPQWQPLALVHAPWERPPRPRPGGDLVVPRSCPTAHNDDNAFPPHSWLPKGTGVRRGCARGKACSRACNLKRTAAQFKLAVRYPDRSCGLGAWRLLLPATNNNGAAAVAPVPEGWWRQGHDRQPTRHLPNPPWHHQQQVQPCMQWLWGGGGAGTGPAWVPGSPAGGRHRSMSPSPTVFPPLARARAHPSRIVRNHGSCCTRARVMGNCGVVGTTPAGWVQRAAGGGPGRWAQGFVQDASVSPSRTGSRQPSPLRPAQTPIHRLANIWPFAHGEVVATEDATGCPTQVPTTANHFGHH